MKRFIIKRKSSLAHQIINVLAAFLRSSPKLEACGTDHFTV